MTVTEYPIYVAGQTLTADELNLLADHSFYRDRLLGRLIGFGVNCGYTGSFAGSKLTIQPGLAVDQRGEPLVMTSPWSQDFPAPADMIAATPYPFIDSTKDGWSVIARLDDTEEAHQECTESGCEGHSVKHSTGVAIDIVKGQITGGRFDFANHDVLKISPLLLSAAGALTGTIGTFKSDLIKVLNTLSSAVAEHSGQVNQATYSTSDAIAVRGYNIGWLNTVLMAAVDLARCQALNSIECFRKDNFPGVVLGYVSKSGSTWAFDCAFKHYWEPPKGLSQALLGGTCTSVCGASESYLISVLEGYAPPTPPAAPPGSPGDGVIIDPPLHYCPKATFDCGNIVVHPGPKIAGVYPPAKIIIKVPPGPDDFKPNNVDMDPSIRTQDILTDVFGKIKYNSLDDGAFQGAGLVGHWGTRAQATITQAIASAGGTPVVTVLTEQEFSTALEGSELAGYQSGTAFAGSDHVVLITDSKGAVTGMGTIPGMLAVRDAGYTAITAQAASTTAANAHTQVLSFKADFDAGMQELDTGMKAFRDDLSALHTDLASVKGSALDFGLMTQRVAALEDKTARLDDINGRVFKLEGKAIAETGTLGAKSYTVDVGNTLAEFAQTTVAAMKTIDAAKNKNLPTYIEAAERKQSELELAVRAGDPELVATATLNLLDSMRTMVGAAGITASAKRQVDAQFRAIQEILG